MNKQNKTLDLCDYRTLCDEVKRIGGSEILYVGVYGSRPKGYARAGSDMDVFVIYSHSQPIAQQLLFNNSEAFEVKPNSGEHPFWHVSSDGTEWQFKLIPVQHFIAQVCGGNYDMLQAVHNPLLSMSGFESVVTDIWSMSNDGYDFAAVAQHKYRASYRMAQSLLTSNDFSSNVHDRRMANSTSRLADSLHAFMTSMVIMHKFDPFTFVECDYFRLLDIYETIPGIPVEPHLIRELHCMHSSNVDKEKVYLFVKEKIAQKIIDYREHFDKWKPGKIQARVDARNAYSRVIHTKALQAVAK